VIIISSGILPVQRSRQVFQWANSGKKS